jgi:hypothetical protein
MASAAESELAALFVTAREMIPHQQTLIAMGWPQPKPPIQTDNSTAAGVTNKTIVPRRVKMMDMRLWWLRCRALKTNSATTGMPDPKTGPITIPSTTRTPATKHTVSHMLESGNHQANSPCAHVVIFCTLVIFHTSVICCTSRGNINHMCLERATLAKPLAHGFPSSGFPFLFYFFNLLTIIPHIMNVATRVCRSLIPGPGQTIPRSVSRTCQHHLNVAQEPSWLS